MSFSLTPILKLVLIGNAGVGKTTLLRHFADSSFPNDVQPTLTPEFRICPIETHSHRAAHRAHSGHKTRYSVRENTKIRLQIWDTPCGHQGPSAAVSAAYFQAAHIIFIIYDASESGTKLLLDRWLESVHQFCGEDTLVYIVGNKSDLVERGAGEENGTCCEEESSEGGQEHDKEEIRKERSRISDGKSAVEGEEEQDGLRRGEDILNCPHYLISSLNLKQIRALFQLAATESAMSRGYDHSDVVRVSSDEDPLLLQGESSDDVEIEEEPFIGVDDRMDGDWVLVPTNDEIVERERYDDMMRSRSRKPTFRDRMRQFLGSKDHAKEKEEDRGNGKHKTKGKEEGGCSLM